MKEVIQKLAQTGDEIYAKVCKVISVDIENKTADLQPLDGSAEIDDAYLMTDDKNGGVFLLPEIGSLVTVVFISKEIAVVVNTSAIQKHQVKIKNVALNIDASGFLLKKENETLKGLMVDLISAVKKMKFTTTSGTTINLLNLTEFDTLEARFKEFLN